MARLSRMNQWATALVKWVLRIVYRSRPRNHQNPQRSPQPTVSQTALPAPLIPGNYQQEQTERLLSNTLPAPIAKRLKLQEDAIADSFEEVTILFADLVNFIQWASEITPTALVSYLNDIFSVFDQLTEKHGLEKIKTIGDAYMVAGGLPIPSNHHVEAIAEIGLDMVDAIAQFNTKQETHLNLCVGINTGPVVAGVIGTKKFSYDLWGDTVNLASRMEPHGLPGRIQVTETTYKRLQNLYSFEERGLIAIKDKGLMKTYFMTGKITQT